MMEINTALFYALKRCTQLQEIITSWEDREKCHDKKHRNEMGAWRKLMHSVGVQHHELPEMPYVNLDYIGELRRRETGRKHDRKTNNYIHVDETCIGNVE